MMTEQQHYYTENPDVAHNPIKWNFDLVGRKFIFTSDNGVFSKHTVDYGSRVLINNVNLDNLPEGPILDLGTGYGPIGLSIATLVPDRNVEMVDVNLRALELAQQNAQANQISNVKIHQSDIYDQVDSKFAAIVTNPPVRAGKKVVDEMIAKADEHLLTNGTLTVVLQKKQGAPSAKRLMEKTFGNCQIIKRDKGYYILQSTKE